MNLSEIKANEALMTELLADTDITGKVKDNLLASGLSLLTEKELADKIGEAVRSTHETFETTIKELTGIDKPVNTKSFDYAKLAYNKKVEALNNQIKELEAQSKNQKNKVTQEIENQQIADLQEQLKTLKEERDAEKAKAFQTSVSAEIGKIDLAIPTAFIEARFKAEHEYVEHDGKMFWKNKETGKFLTSAEKAGEPLTISEIIKASYPEALKKEQQKKTGLGLQDEKKSEFTVDREDYTYDEAEAILNKLGITDFDLDEKGEPKREKLLRKMTSKRYSKK